jgi:hypothetical protein
LEGSRGRPSRGSFAATNCLDGKPPQEVRQAMQRKHLVGASTAPW